MGGKLTTNQGVLKLKMKNAVKTDRPAGQVPLKEKTILLLFTFYLTFNIFKKKYIMFKYG